MNGSWDDKGLQVAIKNTSGERIPPFAAMEVSYTGTSGVSLDSLKNVLWSVKKPTSAGAADSSRIIINGSQWIEISGYGSGWFQSKGLVLFDSSDAPAIGDAVGPVDGEWAMAVGGSGWKYKSDDVNPEAYLQSSSVKTAYVEMVGGGGGDAILFITRTGGIAARSTTTLPHTFPSATVDLLDPSTGNLYSPNRTAEVHNSTTIAIAHVAYRPHQGKKIGNRYFVDVDDC